MAVPGGLGFQLGFGSESNYGVYATPTTFIKPEEGVNFDTNLSYQRYSGLGGNQLMQEDGLHIQTVRDARLSIPAVVRDNGFGRLFNLLHGETVTPAALTGGIYRQVHRIGRSSPVGKSLTMQVGAPQKDGTVQPFSHLGCKATSLTLSLDIDGAVMSSWDIDAQDVVTSESIATATYPTGSKPFIGVTSGTSVEFDDVIITECVRSWTLTLPIPMNTADRCLGSGGLKTEPMINGKIEPTLTLEMQFQSMTEYQAFRASRRRKVELLCRGSNGSGTYGTALNITASTATPVTGGARVNGFDLLTQTVTFDLTDAGATDAPLIIEYLTRDSAL